MLGNPKRVIGLLLLIGIIIGATQFAPGNKAPDTVAVEKQPYQERYPKTRWAIQTASRLYFTNSFTDNGKLVSTTGYWDYTAKEWEYHKTSLTMARKLYGDIKIYETN